MGIATSRKLLAKNFALLSHDADTAFLDEACCITSIY
jgi:hypothetical protein